MQIPNLSSATTLTPVSGTSAGAGAAPAEGETHPFAKLLSGAKRAGAHVAGAHVDSHAKSSGSMEAAPVDPKATAAVALDDAGEAAAQAAVPAAPGIVSPGSRTPATPTRATVRSDSDALEKADDAIATASDAAPCAKDKPQDPSVTPTAPSSDMVAAFSRPQPAPNAVAARTQAGHDDGLPTTAAALPALPAAAKATTDKGAAAAPSVRDSQPTNPIEGAKPQERAADKPAPVQIDTPPQPVIDASLLKPVLEKERLELRTPDAAPGTPGVHAASGAMQAASRADSPPMPAPVSTTVATPVTTPEFREALGVQVSVLTRDGVQHAELHLNPADMGPISVQIAVEGTRAQVDFGVDSSATRQIIESGLPELAAALRDAGFTLAGGGVSQHSRGRSDADEASPRQGSGARRIDASGDSSSGVRRVQVTLPRGAVDLYA